MTYSIVARDPVTGALGVAVASHYFATGRVVTWAEAGVGAVATQSLPDVGYGPRGLERMRSGETATSALAALVAADAMQAVRQVAMVDATGTVATHTGALCIGEAGHATGDQVSVQANMMARGSVCAAMLRAYASASDLDLAGRLLAALDAAEAEGGDVRGRQSATLLVVSGQRSDAPWDQKLFDLRVDDHPEPLVELRRLLGAARAFDRLSGVFQGGMLFAALEPESPALAQALDALGQTQRALGGANLEPTFWRAVLLAKSGRLDEAREALRVATAAHAGWGELIGRLAPLGILPIDVQTLAKLRT